MFVIWRNTSSSSTVWARDFSTLFLRTCHSERIHTSTVSNLLLTRFNTWGYLSLWDGKWRVWMGLTELGLSWIVMRYDLIVFCEYRFIKLTTIIILIWRATNKQYWEYFCLSQFSWSFGTFWFFYPSPLTSFSPFWVYALEIYTSNP